MGFAVIALVTLLYAVYENSHLDMSEKEYRQVGSIKLWIRLLTRGYIANFTLLDFRTTNYNSSSNKWFDESDEHLHKKHSFSSTDDAHKSPTYSDKCHEDKRTPKGDFHIQARGARIQERFL